MHRTLTLSKKQHVNALQTYTQIKVIKQTSVRELIFIPVPVFACTVAFSNMSGGIATKPTHMMREVSCEELAGVKDRMSRYLPHSASVSSLFLFIYLFVYFRPLK